jgi:two-component system sensor histidine kinase YesM
MKASTHTMPLRRRFFFAFLGMALVPLVGASLLAVGTTTQALRDKIGTYSLQLVDQIALNLESEFLKVKGLTDDILISPEVSGRMVGYRLAAAPDRAMSRFIFSKLIQNKFLNVDYVDDVVMLFGSPKDGAPSDLIHATDQYSWTVAALDKLVRSIPASGEVKNLSLTLTALPGTGRTDIVLVRPVRNSLVDETLGYLLVVLDPEYFVRIFRPVDVGAGSDVFVVDSGGRVVASRNAARPLGSPAIPAAWMAPDWAAHPFLRAWEGEEHLFSVAALGATGWTVVGAIPSSYLDSETGKIGTQVFLFSLGALLLALLVSLQISESFAAPLRNLERTMGLFGEGVMQVRSEVERDDEVGRLQRSFNTMAGDITRLLGRIDEEHRRRQLSELQVLEYQINPHFLYNTLDSINWMAQRAQQKEISAIVTALARLFRLSLSRGREVYRVRDELDHVKAYLSISQMRYPDCFTFEFDVEPDILERRTLKIVLQPLVENAIKHGMDKRSTGGTIRIEGRSVAGGLEWRVIDNGKGIAPPRLEALAQRLAAATDDDSGPGGFGLVNVHHRIQLNYGPAFGLNLQSEPGAGTIVRVFLPWEPDTDPKTTEDEISNEKTNL